MDNLILAIGGGAETVGVFAKLLSLIGATYYYFAIAAIIGITAFIVTHKSVRIYQKSLSRIVEKIKNNKKFYEKEEDLTKSDKLSKKHTKLIKKLDRKIKTIITYNRKKIYIPTKLINDKENLSIDPKNSFTFESLLNKYIKKVSNKKDSNTKDNIKSTQVIYTDSLGKREFNENDEIKEDEIIEIKPEQLQMDLTEEFAEKKSTKVTTKKASKSSTYIYKDSDEKTFMP